MKQPEFEVYKAKDGHRWRLKAANGKVIAESGEAYSKKPNAQRIQDLLEFSILNCKVKS